MMGGMFSSILKKCVPRRLTKKWEEILQCLSSGADGLAWNFVLACLGVGRGGILGENIIFYFKKTRKFRDP